MNECKQGGSEKEGEETYLFLIEEEEEQQLISSQILLYFSLKLVNAPRLAIFVTPHFVLMLRTCLPTCLSVCQPVYLLKESQRGEKITDLLTASTNLAANKRAVRA